MISFVSLDYNNPSVLYRTSRIKTKLLYHVRDVVTEDEWTFDKSPHGEVRD